MYLIYHVTVYVSVENIGPIVSDVAYVVNMPAGL